MHIKPIYGNGWVDIASQAPMAPPLPFELMPEIAELGHIEGLVSQSGHPMHGMYVVLTRRYIQGEEDFNVDAFNVRPLHNSNIDQPRYNGFAVVVDSQSHP
jgi:hypothetical protein